MKKKPSQNLLTISASSNRKTYGQENFRVFLLSQKLFAPARSKNATGCRTAGLSHKLLLVFEVEPSHATDTKQGGSFKTL